jgi:hypothetical protein
MSSAAGGAPAALRPADLPHDTAAAIRDTVDGGPIPNLTWAVAESLTHTRTTKKIGEGGFGEVFKGTGVILPVLSVAFSKRSLLVCA